MPRQIKLSNNQLILIISAHKESRATVEAPLRMAGFMSEAICDCETLANSSHLCPDLIIILEPQLPCHGIHRLNMIRSIPGRETIPVILTPESIEPELLVNLQADGAADYVRAPVDPEQLLFRVRQLLSINRETKAHAENRERLVKAHPVEDQLEMLKEAVDSLPIGITLSDINGRIIYSNPTEAMIHGYKVEELIGREASHFAPKKMRKPITALRMQEIKAWKRESVNLKKNGEEFPVQLTSIAVKNADRCLGIVTTCEDISERKESQQKIYQLANLDPLTELPNRRMFHDRLDHALALARREEGKVCVTYLDLDNFKDVNDSQGHDFGDKLLQNVASRLSAIMRESDTLARLGGDEFVVIMVSVRKHEDFAAAAQRMLSVFYQPFEINDRLIYSSASIGIAVFPADGDTGDVLLQSADTAMYQVKQEGKSGFRFFSTEMNERITHRVAMETALRNGLNNGEFFLHYQPQWDMRTKRLIGAEALLRWQSNEFGLILPGEFISLIEDSGLIFTIGEWVLRTACLQARYWAASGNKQVRVAINISGKQLKQPDFLAVISRVLREVGVNPGHIDLEFTESVIMEQAEKTIEILKELKKMGFFLSVDDFGTGYSSLNYLKNFPIDRIKIDRSFVTDINHSMDNAAIVKAIISLAKVLKLKVIAEGIENSDQLHCLLKLGCHEMQGFLLGKPMTAGEVATAMPTSTITILT